MIGGKEHHIALPLKPDIEKQVLNPVLKENNSEI
jgi:hypothetical protein